VFSKGPIQEDIIIDYAIQLCDLFHYLHTTDRPILYVDLKPDNILISDNSLKLIDFGSAIYQDENTMKRKLTATIGYAAPELYRQGRLDDRCDVYGIGMLLYYMVTGTMITPRMKQISNIDQMSGCSKELKNIINHCLRFNPAFRYMTVAQLKKHLSARIPGRGVCQETSRGRTVAVAGAQPRIGVTHMAFRLCRYMKSQKMDCLYKEDNPSQCVSRMKGHLERTKEGALDLEGIPIHPKELSRDLGSSEASVTVIDYGTLSKDNLEEFLEADTRLLVMGAKEWELNYSEEVLEMIAEYKDIIYLFNFLDGKQFQFVCKNMEQRSCFRIPYEPDPFRKITSQNGLELFKELIGYHDDRVRRGRKLRKRKGRPQP
jgi:serine/threonine-protein kinase